MSTTRSRTARLPHSARALTDPRGVIDLVSVMIGVLVLGILSAAITVTVFTAIPWVQDQEAQSRLGSVSVTQSVAKRQQYRYLNYTDLVTDTNLLQEQDGLLIGVNARGTCYVAVSTSDSGNQFFSTSKNHDPQPLTSPTVEADTSWCLDIDALLAGQPTEVGIMVSTWDTTSADCKNIQLPINPATGNGTVDWGDGTVSEFTNRPSHEYTDSGLVTITVNGNFWTWAGYAPAGMDGGIYTVHPTWPANCLIEISEWFGTETTNLAYGFAGTKNLTAVHEIPDTVTNLSYVFWQSNFNGDVTRWDTSKVTTMRGAFRTAGLFNRSLATWDTSNVTTMQEMFNGATSFNKPIGGWNVGKVTNFYQAFDHALAFNQPIGTWNTTSATTMGYMFNTAEQFNQDLSGWNTSSVTNMSLMFYDAAKFNGAIGTWDMGNVKDMYWMFMYADAFNQPIGTWDVSSAINMSNMFMVAKAFNQPLAAWNVSNATNMHNMFFMAGAFNQDLSGWNVIKVSDHGGFSDWSSMIPSHLPHFI